jgi:hypothetical protein
MKKLLAVLLALCVVGGAFAQVTFSGYERLVATTNSDGVAMANRIRFNFTVTDPDGNYGAWGRYQFADAASPTVNYAYGWMKFGTFAKVTAGILGNYDYDLSSGSASDYAATGNVSNDMVILDNQKGALLQFYPVAGLNLGLTVIPAATDVGLGAFGFNAKYDITDIGAIVVTSWLKDAIADSAFSASFNLTAVKAFDISAGFKYGSGIGYKNAVAQNMTAYAIVNYSGDALSAQFATEYDITGADLYLEGYVDYALSALTLRGVAAYETAATAQTGNTYYLGAEAIYKVGKAQLWNGFYYGDVDTWSIKTAVKVAF